jgi:hypothetical protein
LKSHIRVLEEKNLAGDKGMGRRYWIIVILLFSLIFARGCTTYQPIYEVGDIIINTKGGPCYGLLIERYHEAEIFYYFKNVTRCNLTNILQWKYVGTILGEMTISKSISIH